MRFSEFVRLVFWVLVILGLASVAHAIFDPKPANAQQPPCGPAEDMERMLRDRFGETAVWVGADKNGTAFFLSQSAKGSWTIYTRRGPIACLVAVGEGGQLNDPPKGESF